MHGAGIQSALPFCSFPPWPHRSAQGATNAISLSRYPQGYRPGQSRWRPPPPKRRARSPNERLALYRLDARGQRRLAPFAYVAISLAAINLAAVVLVVVALFNQDLRLAAEGVVGRIVGIPEAHPVTWTVHLDRALDGHEYFAVDQPEVAERVKQDFLETWRWYYASESFPIADEAGRHFTGGYLRAIRYGLDYYAAQGYYAYWRVEQIEWVGDLEFSEDGSRVTLTANLAGPFEVEQRDAARPGVTLQTISRTAWTLRTPLTWSTQLGRWLAYDDVSGNPLEAQ